MYSESVIGESITLGLLLLVNAAGVLMVLFQLPGTWLILTATGVAFWLLRDSQILGWWLVAVLLVLAILGEIVETASGAIGSRRSGGSRRGALLSVPTAIVGAAVGAAVAGSLTLAFLWVVPVWLVIVMAGGALGAAAGAALGDRLAGRTWTDAGRAGYGAAMGRLWGTVGKLLIAAVMWAAVVTAIFV